MRINYTCVLFTCLLVTGIAKAGIVKIVISQKESPAFGGKAFGAAGTYDRFRGKAYGEVDPSLPQNAKIIDIQLAPRNAKGMVEYAMDIEILQPTDLLKGNHKLFAEIPNRGGKLYNGFNKSSGGSDDFLLNMGYTVAWCGWDVSARAVNDNMTITVPVAKNKAGSAITGLSYEYISFDNNSTLQYRLTYPVADKKREKASLTYKMLLNDVAETIPPNGWEYATDSTIRLLPEGTPFKQSAIYEFVYEAKDPLVAGLGLAATRDFISFLRYSKNDNLLAGYLQYVYSFAISQPARYMNDFQTLGFNVDEQGRTVFDGIENWLGGGSGVGINVRFAQPGRTERNRQNHLYPEGVFPFAYPVMTDPNSGITGGRGQIKTSTKILEINSANEYWVKAASLLHTDLQGNDLPDPPNVRFYLLSGMQHGSGNGKGICQQLQNPTSAEPVLRALFIALDEWVTKGVQPPESNVPRRSNATAVMAVSRPGSLTGTVPGDSLGWPAIPGVTYTGLITTRHYFAGYPVTKITGPVYPAFVSKVDADGNEIAGVRLPPVAAPVATLTGWALRVEGYGKNDGGESAGQYIPFAVTRAARLAAGDPRLSLEERYKTHAGYVQAVTTAVQKLVNQRLLLQEDANVYIREAEESGVLR